MWQSRPCHSIVEDKDERKNASMSLGNKIYQCNLYMSIATLKKKTASKYRNNSANVPHFSLNGTHRNQGYVGQTSLSRTILQTPSSGTESQGHGGCCGQYEHCDLHTSSIHSTENSEYIKASVLSTSGMLAKRTQWVRRPEPYSVTKPSDSINQSSSGSYVVFKRKAAIKNGMDISSCNHVAQTICQMKAEIPNAPKSQGEYILKLISDCAVLDISFVNYSTNAGKPVITC